MDRRFRRAFFIPATMVLAGVLFSPVRSEDSAAQWRVPKREAERKNPIPSDPKSIAAGKIVYEKNCATCHGPTGKGDGPKGRDLQPKPGDLSSPQLASQSDGAIYWKTTTGRRPMPAFEKLLSEQDRWHVVNYVRSLGGNAQAKGKS